MLDPNVELLNAPFVQEQVMRALQQGLQWYQESMSNVLRANLQYLPIQSPLEAAFVAWWCVVAGARDYYHDVRLIPQHEVTVDRRTVRLDFAMMPNDPELLAHAERNHIAIPRVGVELIDHDADGGTTVPLAARMMRDRSRSLSGWQIFHVSGSEFYRDPVASVDAVYTAATGAIWDLRHRLGWAVERKREPGTIGAQQCTVAS